MTNFGNGNGFPESAISSLLWNFLILDTDVVEDGRDSPEAIIGVHVSNFMRLN